MKTHQIKTYLKHLWCAKGIQSAHSPFMFQWLNEVWYDERTFYQFAQIEKIRTQLLSNTTTINVTDLGAGSQQSSSKTRKISEIAKNALKSKNLAQKLFKHCLYTQPKVIVELGTSLGITTAYLAAANPLSTIVTIEGCPLISAQAQKTFAQLGLQNIHCHVGNFDTEIQNITAQYPQIDFLYIDGNHLYQPTINYLNHFEPYLSNNATVVLDDIYWSPQMTQAWEYAIQKPAFTLSIDTWWLGFLIKNPGVQQKQNFKIK